jgi:hypothetical protein
LLTGLRYLSPARGVGSAIYDRGWSFFIHLFRPLCPNADIYKNEA